MSGNPTMLYLLERLGDISYDEACAFVIEAESPRQARKIAGESCGDEGPGTWMNGEKTSCKPLRLQGKPGLIMRDFLNG